MRKITSMYVLNLGTWAFLYSPKKQQVVTLLTIKAKYMNQYVKLFDSQDI